ncbi:MAG: hypothetical protein K2G62_03820, partial [Oscillospiraceae bacterium]|nr:hypothetical protein [Oscillospiraceae bacterium]
TQTDPPRILVLSLCYYYIEKFAGGGGSELGTGGMATKINAAKIAGEAGIDMIIMNGSNPYKRYDLFENKETGTLFISNLNKSQNGD